MCIKCIRTSNSVCVCVRASGNSPSLKNPSGKWMAFCIVRCVSLKAIFHRLIHTHTRACWLVLILWYTYYTLGRVGTIHHLKRSKYTTVIRLEAPAAPRTPWPGAREHFGKCSFLTLSSAEYIHGRAHSPVSCMRTAKPTAKTRSGYYRKLICLWG